MENYETEVAADVSVQSLRVLSDNENFKRRDELVDENTIRSTFAVRQDADSPRYEESVTFDFSGVSREQLMLLSCTNGLVVWAQRVLREMGHGLTNPANLSNVSVLENVIEGATRVVSSPKDRALRALSRLSPEERAAILAEFQI